MKYPKLGFFGLKIPKPSGNPDCEVLAQNFESYSKFFCICFSSSLRVAAVADVLLGHKNVAASFRMSWKVKNSLDQKIGLLQPQVDFDVQGIPILWQQINNSLQQKFTTPQVA
jgi:hypothetical protein